MATGRVLYFLAGNALGGQELWRSDGTAWGTSKVKDVYPGHMDASYAPSLMLGLADRDQVLLRSADAASGLELWVSEGFEAGTTRVADLAPGPRTSDPRSFVRSGDSVFFSADDGVHGAELWRLTLPPVGPDTTRPVLVCPEGVTVEASSSAGTLVSWPGARVSDDVSASVPLTYSHRSGTAFPLGKTVVTVTARDEAGNASSCGFDVRVFDSTAPSVTCPAAFTREATTGLGTRVTYEATAEDSVSPVTLAYSPASGAVLGQGTTVVTVTVRDTSGNEATCSFAVTLRDSTAPTLTCPEAVRVEATGPSGAPVTFAAATVRDAVTPHPEVTYSPASGSAFPVGESPVAVTAKDAAGNTASCSFRVAVNQVIMDEGGGCAAAGGSPAGLLGLLLLLAWPSLGRAWARRG